MNTKRKVWLFLPFLLVNYYTQGFSQNIIFSQYFLTPWLTNPALTGMFKGDYRTFRGDFRLSTHYRNQLNTSNFQHNSYSVSADMPSSKKC